MNELDMVKAISEFVKRSIDNNPSEVACRA